MTNKVKVAILVVATQLRLLFPPPRTGGGIAQAARAPVIPDKSNTQRQARSCNHYTIAAVTSESNQVSMVQWCAREIDPEPLRPGVRLPH